MPCFVHFIPVSAVQKLLKSVKIWQSCSQMYTATFYKQRQKCRFYFFQVRCAHKSGDVINFIIVACRISSWLKWYKNYKNWLRLAKVIVRNKMSRFFMVHCVYLPAGNTVWVKKVAPHLKLFAIFSLAVNLFNWKLPQLYLWFHQFWSTYLNICMNCITFTSKTPPILTIQFSLLRSSWFFFGWQTSHITWTLSNSNSNFVTSVTRSLATAKKACI